MKKKIMFIAIFLLALSAGVFAWDVNLGGLITRIEVTHEGNYGLRIYIGDEWAYLEKEDSNYKTFLSILSLAYATDSEVILNCEKPGSHPHVLYVQMIK